MLKKASPVLNCWPGPHLLAHEAEHQILPPLPDLTLHQEAPLLLVKKGMEWNRKCGEENGEESGGTQAWHSTLLLTFSSILLPSSFVKKSRKSGKGDSLSQFTVSVNLMEGPALFQLVTVLLKVQEPCQKKRKTNDKSSYPFSPNQGNTSMHTHIDQDLTLNKQILDLLPIAPFCSLGYRLLYFA